MDFDGSNLPELKSTLEVKYRDVKVQLVSFPGFARANYKQVTVIEADAADEAAISAVCKQALQEEGRLDVFFANVCMCLSLRNMASLNYSC